jgi:hypothetical protein
MSDFRRNDVLPIGVKLVSQSMLAMLLFLDRDGLVKKSERGEEGLRRGFEEGLTRSGTAEEEEGESSGKREVLHTDSFGTSKEEPSSDTSIKGGGGMLKAARHSAILSSWLSSLLESMASISGSMSKREEVMNSIMMYSREASYILFSCFIPQKVLLLSFSSPNPPKVGGFTPTYARGSRVIKLSRE